MKEFIYSIFIMPIVEIFRILNFDGSLLCSNNRMLVLLVLLPDLLLPLYLHGNSCDHQIDHHGERGETLLPQASLV